ncbi:MAG: DUF4352 domain-containing protein [Deltaproteobacteria bacterium]|nr:DUF4352 domain-containing protein [Deltaproteobacteria bacterium]
MVRGAVIALAALCAFSFSGAVGQETPPETAAPPGPRYEILPMGEPLQVGQLRYSVKRAYWDAVVESPTGETVEYLIVEVSVRNLSAERLQIPPFKMYDDQGELYEPSYAKLVFPKMSLDPGEEERGRVFFLAPKDRSYWFIASGEFRSGQFALVALEPTEPVA